MIGRHALYSTLTEVFPPPRFLEMPSVGLDVSDKFIRFAELKRRHTHFEIGKFGEEKVPAGVIEDGYIKDPAKLTEILRSIQKTNGLHFVKVSLPETKSYLFNTTIPEMNDGDIRSVLEFKIEENVPIALAEAVFDYRIIHGTNVEAGKRMVSVTVVHKKVAESYSDVLRAANLVPLSFHIESEAIAHAILPRDESGTHILIAIRSSRTVLCIISGGEVQFTSTLPIGGEVIADSLAKNLEMGRDEVEKIRQGREIIESNKMFLSLVNAATALRDEVQKLMKYWDSRTDDDSKFRTIEKIILCGGDAMLGVDDYLARSLDIKTVIANPWVNIEPLTCDVPPLTLREALNYVPALGLALSYD